MANGEIPFHTRAIQTLRDADFLICCDGAIEKLCQLGFEPNLIIGDLDSISSDFRAKYSKIIREESSVEVCDLHKAILYCEKENFEKVTIVGAGGLREDHALANISLLMTYGLDLNISMVTNYGVFTPIFKTSTLDSFAGQQVSVFNFGEAKVTFQNLRYPVEDREFNYFWEGSLNESLGETFTISFPKGRVLVFQTHPQ